MLKKILTVTIIGLFFVACGGNTETTEATQEEIEAIEQSNQELDEVINSSTEEIDTLQSEIDNLLNNI